MELFERYLQAVRGCLPKRQREDIIRELSEDLASQAEDREAELGRPLSQAEQAAILKPYGHPMLLAARYRPRQQVIGSAVFPFYWFVLKMALLGMLLVHLVAAAAMLAMGKPAADVISALVSVPIGKGITVFGWVTLVFALLDRHLTSLPFFVDWNPSTLPALRKGAPGPSRISLIGEILLTTTFILWWAAAPRYPWLVFGPAWTIIELAPVWHTLHVPVLLVATASLAVMWIGLVRPDWLMLRSISRIVTNLFSLVIFSLLMNAGDLVVASETAVASVARVVGVVNTAFSVALVVGAIGMLVEIVREVVRLVKGYQSSAVSRA